MVSLTASSWREVLRVTSHHQMFPNKPPYQSMTSVCPLPSYMSGYLHQLGGHSSGVYRSDHQTANTFLLHIKRYAIESLVEISSCMVEAKNFD